MATAAPRELAARVAAMPGNNATLIYALADPETGAVRYVGKTEKPPARRLADHIAAARRAGHKRRPLAWIASLLAAGKRPRMDHLEVVPAGGDWASAERIWIAKLRAEGCDLTNLADGGEGPAGYRWTQEQIAARRMPRGPDHHQFGKPMSETAATALAAANRAKLADPEWRAWASQQRQSGYTEESRSRSIEALHRARTNPAAKAKRAASLRKATERPEYKAEVAAKSRATWAAKRDEIIAAQNAGKGDAYKAKQAAAKRAQWADPDWRVKNLASRVGKRVAMKEPEYREKKRQLLKARWAENREQMLADRAAARARKAEA